MVLATLLRYTDQQQGGHWDHVFLIQHDYQLMAEKHGITLCPILGPQDAQKICDICDGLIIPGSGNPIFLQYGGDTEPDAHPVDECGHDFQIIDMFVKAKKPIFGICRGIQILNLYFGGTLRKVNINWSHGLPKVDQKQMHPITVKKDSFVYDVFGAERATVNSHHGWGIDRLAEGLEAVATADDGVIEAVQHKTLPVFATQWHPEQTFHVGPPLEDPIEQKFFENFIDLCKRYQA